MDLTSGRSSPDGLARSSPNTVWSTYSNTRYSRPLVLWYAWTCVHQGGGEQQVKVPRPRPVGCRRVQQLTSGRRGGGEGSRRGLLRSRPVGCRRVQQLTSGRRGGGEGSRRGLLRSRPVGCVRMDKLAR
eukprot:144357-Chlamydomonas_euryale.AAC.2